MSLHDAVPGTQTVTVTKTPLTYPTGLPLEPFGPASTMIPTTFVPLGGTIVLFPGLVPSGLSEQPENATISEAERRNRRTRTPLLDVGGLNARGNEARDVSAP